MIEKSQYEEWLIDPSAHFSNPDEIVALETISKEQKVCLLQQWERDAKQLQLASEEGMLGGESNALSAVENALLDLNAGKDGDPSPAK